MKKPSEEEKFDINNILRNEVDSEESIYCKIIENKTIKTSTQFKVTIPQKFASTMGLNKKDFEVKFTLFKSINKNNEIKHKLIGEVVKIV